jgi:hypothetical protein
MGRRRDDYDDDDYDRPRRVVHHHYHAEKSGGTAAILEILPGLLIQTFGIGHMYAGNVAVGLLFMFGYWFVLAVNIALCFVLIGFVTLPLCWIGAMILSPILASASCSSR